MERSGVNWAVQPNLGAADVEPGGDQPDSSDLPTQLTQLKST